MERRVKMGLVGGGFGCAFQFGVHPGCKVVAVADLRPDRREALRNYYRCDTVYHTLEELLRDPNMEAVGLFTPRPCTPGTASPRSRQASTSSARFPPPLRW